LWEEQFPLILHNVIKACKISGAKLGYFDNTYMYPQNDCIQTEQTSFNPVGRKGRVRKEMTEMLLSEMKSGEIEAVICRAPEFYGPDKTQSITNTLVFDNIKDGKKIKISLRDSKKRSLIWTPDASRATALIGNSPDTFGQTWHLPVDDSHPTYKELIALASKIYEKKLKYTVVPKLMFKIGARFNERIKELLELLPRYEHDNIFDDSKFRKRFSDFQSTSYEDGMKQIREKEMK